MTALNQIVHWLWLIIQLPFAVYMLIPLISIIIYALVNLLGLKTPLQKRRKLTDKNFEFAIVITAHQEAAFVMPLVDSILKQQYGQFYVYVVADDCKPSDFNFTDPRVQVLFPDPPLHAKIRSIQYALERFKKKHDVLIILDADNLIHPEFLAEMNLHFQKGYRVVQCDFKPKNTDSMYARMDAIGDMFNFFTEREVRMRVNLSATIWGSGVAMDQKLYEEIEYRDRLGGFDKKLQSHLVQQVDRIGFSTRAILYDEKITTGKSLETQRTRWINAYFKYFSESMAIIKKGLKNRSFNLLYFGFNALRPPLFIVWFASIAFCIINYFVKSFSFYIWIGIMLSFIISFITIVLIKSRDIRYLGTICMIPLFVARQVLALFKIGKARKSFMKTEHSKLVYIDDLIQKAGAR